MRAKILAAATLAFVAACQPPAANPAAMQAHADSVKAGIGAMTAHYASAMTAGNVDSLLRDYDNDAVVMAPNMRASRGMDAIKASYTQMLAAGKPTQFHLMSANTSVSGDLATDRGRYHWVGPIPGGATVTDSGSYLATYEKKGNDWKLTSTIWNSDNPAMPMPPAPGRRG